MPQIADVAIFGIKHPVKASLLVAEKRGKGAKGGRGKAGLHYPPPRNRTQHCSKKVSPACESENAN